MGEHVYGWNLLAEQALTLATGGLTHDALVTELTLVATDVRAFELARRSLIGRDLGAVGEAADRALADAALEIDDLLVAA